MPPHAAADTIADDNDMDVVSAATVHTPPAAGPPMVHGERPVIYCKSIQGGALRTLFEVLKEIVHDISLQFDSTGIRLLTMDGARCALICMKLRADSFEEYACDDKYAVGVNVASLFKLIRITGSHDTVTFYMLPSASNELGITIQNADKNSTTDFRLKLLDVDSEEITIPDVEFDSVITMPSAYFQRLCRDALNLADHMTIRSHNGTLTLSCTGDFARQETVIGQADAGMAISSRPDAGKVEGKFSLKYLSLFCKSSSLCNTLELYVKESFPLIMKYNIASLGEVKFVLAPSADES
jgi:proliferating cell nuclear antigen